VYYKKKIPEHFSKDSDDLLVRSLITKYAVEGRVNGKPNGFFRQLVGEVEVNNKLQMQLDSDLSADFENRPDPVLSPWAAKPVIQVPPYPYDSVKNGF